MKKASRTAGESAPIYDPSRIEKKWQKKWQAAKLYRSKEDLKKAQDKKEKFYVLDMFPYPSGEGLHVGHPKGYIATDIISRMNRMQGKSVLHPMGFDAFGLPAENYAIKTKTNPADAVATNVARFKEQLEIIGLDYDWSREINTTDPAYYKWTQWIFLQLYKKGLAFESFEPINWCPVDKTGLANEDVEDGRCERCGALVEKRPMRQWVLKITDYADRLLADLNAVHGPVFTNTVGSDAFRTDMPVSERHVVHCLVKHWKDDSYLCMKWKKNDWRGFVIGGIENGETAEATAVREVMEETGYKHVVFKRIVSHMTAEFYQQIKKENRRAFITTVYLELTDGEQTEIPQHEKDIQDIEWVPAAQVRNFVNRDDLKYEWDVFTGAVKQPALLDWPNSIKEAQRNWIGKSEGALIKFPIANNQDTNKSQKNIEVFTTRPDTLFGVTYVVLAPEHALVSEFLTYVENKKEVEAYIAQAKLETEIERTDAKKEKTGVELKGVKAINPANGAEVPVWISDYVLADYGTGAVMAVPAHDERDFVFAKKFGLSVKEVIAEETGKKIQGEERRDGVATVIFDPKAQKYAVLNWKINGLYGLLSGGSDAHESSLETLHREVAEESGFHDFKLIEELGHNYAHYYNGLKKIPRVALASGYLLILNSTDAKETNREEHEKFDINWVDSKEIVENWKKHESIGLGHWQMFLQRGVARAIELGYDKTSNAKDFMYTATIGEGILINSGKFDGKNSADIRKDITLSVGGNWVSKYKLRDWVFSRQRYWGEPIPLIHCDKCGVVAVPEKDLPVKLPKVASYEPTGTGESPLAAIHKWVNVKCPQCEIDNNKTKYFIFDFDGVLGDTWEARIEAKLQTGKVKTREESIAASMAYFEKKPDHVRDSGITEEQLKKKVDREKIIGAQVLKINPPLFKEFIQEIKKIKGAKLAVVSSGSGLYVKGLLKKSGLKFTHILSLEDHHSKEEKIEGICKDWKVGLKDVYYFTDTKADVYELENLLDRKKIVGCAWGYMGFDKLKEVLPEKQILKDFKDIHRFFNTDGMAKRETNTMPQWAGSSWYYLRYMDPKNKKALVDQKKEKYWAPVDLYVGGAEHATRHLIYARFWHKFLYDIGVVSTIEPFIRLQHVGLIMGEDGRKMSKRFGNVVNPDEVVKNYGADSLRLYEMFMGPFDQQIAWSTSSIVGVRRFIEKVWKMRDGVSTEKYFEGRFGGNGGDREPAATLASVDSVSRETFSALISRILHKAIKKVTDDIAAMSFNTAISTLMIAVNEITDNPVPPNREQFEILLKLIAPFAPHVAEELWYFLGNKKSIHISEWPAYNEALTVEDEVNIIVQVNGKVRASFKASKTLNEAELETQAKSIPEVQKWLEGKSVKKVIVVKGKLVSIVVA